MQTKLATILKHLIFAVVVSTGIYSQATAATMYPPGSGWQEFSWVNPVGGGYDENSEGAFTFSVTAQQTPVLTVTDAGWNGERIEVFNHGAYAGFWTPSPRGECGTSFTSSYDTATSSAKWSTGVWNLNPGDHELTFKLQQWWIYGDDIPPNTWVAAFKVDVAPVPVPGTLLLFISALTGIVFLAGRRRQS